VIKNRLKSALVAEIIRIELPKEGNLLALPFGLFHISLPDVSRSRQTKLAVRDPLFQGAHPCIVIIPGFDSSHSNSKPVIIAR
jgi:hypothetical protein